MLGCIVAMAEGDALSKLYGARLRAVRLDVGLRQTDVAAELGMSAGGYSSIERGRARMFVSDLPRYAAALRVEPAYLARRLGLCEDGGDDIAHALMQRFGPDLGRTLVRLDMALANIEQGEVDAAILVLESISERGERRERREE